MASNDKIVTGKAYRVWNELLNKWEVFSFWTKASDVEMNDGQTVEAEITNLKSSFSQALIDLRNTAIAQAVGATGSSFASVIATLASIVDRGAINAFVDSSSTSYTIPAGYHNGSGTVSLVNQEKIVTSSRSSQVITPDSGKVLSKVTVNGLEPSGTYSATSRSSSLDMGSTSNYRYVNTNSVPNYNTNTRYQYGVGLIDMGETNSIRYISNDIEVYTSTIRFSYLSDRYYARFDCGRFFGVTDTDDDVTRYNRQFTGNTLVYDYPFMYNVIRIRITRDDTTVTKIELADINSVSTFKVRVVSYGGSTGAYSNGGVHVLPKGGNYVTVWTGSLYCWFNEEGTTPASDSPLVADAALSEITMIAVRNN